MSELFEQAARKKLRFNTSVGVLSTEDLFDLPLTSARGASLDKIAVGLHAELERTQVSFVNDRSAADAQTQLAFDVVKHVIAVKKQEAAEFREASERRAKKQRLLSLIQEKKDAELAGKPLEELEAALAEL